MNKKDYCFLIDTSFDIINETFNDNVYFLRPEIIRTKDKVEETFQDGLNISRDEVIRSLNDNYDLKTCQTPYGLMESTIRNLLNEYNTVFIILITKEFSGMYNSCLKIAKELNKEFSNKNVIVINSLSISMFQNKLMNEIEQMYLDQKPLKQIKEYSDNFYKKTYAFTIITNATQLIKGGRLSGLKAILVKAFNIKLLIEYANGKLTYLNKAAHVEKAIDLGIEKMYEYLDLNNNEIEEIRIYSDLDEEKTKKYAQYIQDKFLQKYPHKMKISQLPTIIITHLGDKSLSLLCKIK